MFEKVRLINPECEHAFRNKSKQTDAYVSNFIRLRNLFKNFFYKIDNTSFP